MKKSFLKTVISEGYEWSITLREMCCVIVCMVGFYLGLLALKISMPFDHATAFGLGLIIGVFLLSGTRVRTIIKEPVCPKCGQYVGGHATGGDDICTCHEDKP